MLVRLTSRQRCGVTRPVTIRRLSERRTDAPTTSSGVSGPREAVRARTESPEAWTGRPSRWAIVGFVVSASMRRVGACVAKAVAIPAARVVRPGAPEVPHTARTEPGRVGSGGGGGAEAMVGFGRHARVAAMSELTTWSGLPGAATEATPRVRSRERSSCGARATTDMPTERREARASDVRSGSAPSMTARSAMPARAAAITSARSAQRRTIARQSERDWIAWIMGASQR